MSPICETAYWLDSSDCIARVSPEWDAFAGANEGRCIAAAVCGNSLWNYIAGDATRMWMEAVVGLARMVGEVSRDYRCDSPDCKRFMRMTIRRDAGNLLHVHHVALREEPMDPPVHIEYRRPGADAFLRRCSICNRLETHRGWLEPDIALGQELVGPGSVRVIYAVCAECMRMLAA